MSCDGNLAFYGQDALAPEVRQAALSAAQAVLSSDGISAREAVEAYAVDLLLAEGLDVAERTDAHYREHGSSLRAAEACSAAQEAAEAEIVRLDPAYEGFGVLFSLAS
ncbi:MAG TPA: hypothetical protein VGN68_00780 [Sphingopyxis sp.]|jgi:hypothetical protein|uniref:hypothetical protein n=1 Tax=Sphingopyxis sp. TaxID=1908224 RepID=UPI002E0FE6AB|nr:hypothetical protein [Sphingopyxis sp.]